MIKKTKTNWPKKGSKYKNFDKTVAKLIEGFCMNMSIQEQSVELSKIMEDIKNKNKIKE